MEIRNAGYNHCHDTDFIIDRPKGSGDNLLLLLKTDCIVTLDGVDQLVPANSVFLYPKDAPQFYRTCPQQLFANDWVHFLFEGEEFSQFSARKIPFQTPIPVQEPNFFSHCIKEIVYETYSQNLYRKESASCYGINSANSCTRILFFQKTAGMKCLPPFAERCTAVHGIHAR